MDHCGHRKFGYLFNPDCGSGMGIFRRRSHLLFPNHIHAGLIGRYLRGEQIQNVETRGIASLQILYQLPDLDYQFNYQ